MRHLRTMIFTGELALGDKIDQDQIAEMMGVSKLPVREALIALELEGLIDNVPRRGAFVAGLTPEDVLDNYRVFGLVSGLAAERAAGALSEDDLDRLTDLEQRIEASPTAAEHSRLSFEFHQIINRAGASHRLRTILKQLASSVPEQFVRFVPSWPDTAHSDHRRLIDALKKGDGAAAREIMEGHLAGAGRHAVETLEQVGFWRDSLGDGQDS